MSSLGEELKALGGDLPAALEDLLMASALLDPAGAVTWQNKKSRELSGDMVGVPFVQFVAERDRERFRRHWRTSSDVASRWSWSSRYATPMDSSPPPR